MSKKTENKAGSVGLGVAKARNWVGVLYPENMFDNWQDRIYRILQVPFEYIIHDKDSIEIEEDVTEPSKTHVHLIVHYTNTTTYKNVMTLLMGLSAPEKRCLNKIEVVASLKYMHRYLTHDTEDCKKAGKYVYNSSDIISGNNWDLGAFIQLEEEEKLLIYNVLRDFAVHHNVFTYIDLEEQVMSGTFDETLADFSTQDIRRYLHNNERLFSSICKQVYFKHKLKQKEKDKVDIEKLVAEKVAQILGVQ